MSKPHQPKRATKLATAKPSPRQVIALRINPDVIAAFRLGAQQQGIGYQTLMHNVLTQAAIDNGWL